MTKVFAEKPKAWSLKLTAFSRSMYEQWERDMSRNSISILDNDYIGWIKELSSRYRRSQVKAATKVNVEMLRFYWELGRDITKRDAEN